MIEVMDTGGMDIIHQPTALGHTGLIVTFIVVLLLI
jgi:hypothetical protein